MSTRQTLIRGGHVLTMDKQLDEIDGCDILIEDGKIIAIGLNIDAPNAVIIEAEDHIVMLGFVDAHRHMWQTQLRAIMGDGTLVDYSTQIRNVYSACYDPDDVYIGILMGYLEAINAGCTTIIDHCHIMNSMVHTQRAIDTFEDSGARGVFCYGLFPNPEDADKPRELTAQLFNPPAYIMENARKIREARFNSDNGRIRFGLALTELEWFPLHFSKREIEFARDLGSQKISIHAGLGASSQYTDYATRLHKAEFIGPDFHFVHGWGFSDNELRLIADGSASLAATPETEMQMAMGFPVTQRFEKAGDKATIGIDIVSNNSADMFTQMRLALAGVRTLRNEKLAHKKLFTEKLDYSTLDVLRAATINGAEALGLGDVTGSLSVGKFADIQLIRKLDIKMAPVINAVHSVVMCANVSNIDMVMVEGKILERGGKLVGHDIVKGAEKLLTSTDHILQRSKLFDMDAAYDSVRSVFPITKSDSRTQKIGAMIFNNASRSISDWVLKKMVR